MKTRALLTQLSAGRIAIGTGLLVRPQLAELWIGKDGRRSTVAVVVRALGIRDAVLGAGTLAATRSGQSLRPWLVAGLASDATDLAATAFARRDLSSGSARAIYAIAGSAVAVGVIAIASGDDLPDA